MPVLIACYYRSPLAAQQRLAIRDRHIEYILQHKESIAFAGAICDAQNQPTGMFVALKTDLGSDADDFIVGEPYNRASLFESVRIDRLMQFIPHSNESFLEEELQREKMRLGR
ncbi:hypothetical protein [Paraburkholderia agricolaris]|uniref:hypothetical protein n=1 Tax=Paraburkholderia agricolaris TaxID=2152888 RepID=UPI001290F745|nr:hypothetical protein [Paraburkholderia agricolaris]